MAKKGVSNTALGAATCRLIEQYQPKEIRLFNDPVVKDLVGMPIRVMMQFASMRNFTLKRMDDITSGIYGAQVCRTRFIDQAVQEVLSGGIKQFVILGAGFDTRPYRLPGIEQVKVYEVDLPSVQNVKKERLQEHFGKLPENITFIPIDFDTQSLEEVFSRTSFNPSVPAVFVWEGVTQYLSEESVRQTLSFIGKSAPGSIVLFTYVLKSIIEKRSEIPNADKMLEAVAHSAPWIFGLEPSNISEFLQAFHLALISDVGNIEYQEKYLRPIKRHLAVFEGERTVQARVISS